MSPRRKRPSCSDELFRTLEALSVSLTSVRLGRAASEAFDGGHSALALAHQALDRALPGRGHAGRARRHMARAIDALGKTSVPPRLYGGFTGVAWVAEHVLGRREDDANAAIDDALARLLAHSPWGESYDLIGGLVGYGVYALERSARPSARVLLEQVVSHLAALAESGPRGITWRSRPAWIPKGITPHPSHGAHNLGLAHGVPGVIALLGRIHRAGVARRETARLLDGAVAWLLAHELPEGSPSRFA